jgi:CheY-like chemotaxis protein
VLVRKRRLRPAVILLDLQLPGMDGIEFLERQHEEPALDDVPVIVLTAQRERLRMRSPTIRGVVEKPYEGAQVLKLVQELCAS